MSRFVTVDYKIPGIGFAAWHGCRDCSGGPAPGARALLAYWLEQAPAIAQELQLAPEGFRSLGIYNCRPIRGSSSLSIHACGRAVDMGVPVTTAGHQVMVAFLRRLAREAEGLGVQLVIFSRLYGSARNPWPTAYGGAHPHFDHAHVELTPNAAGVLTLATLRDRVGDFRVLEEPEQPDPEPDPEPEPPARPDPEPSTPKPDWAGRLVSQMQRVDLSNVESGQQSSFVRGEEVRLLQATLAAAGFPPRLSFNNRGRPDGVGGPNTRSALGEFQKSRRTGVPSSPGRPDFVAGPATWEALLRAGRG